MRTLAAHDHSGAGRVGGQGRSGEQSGDLRDRGLVDRAQLALGVDRGGPVPGSQQRDGGVFAAGDGPADGELAADAGVAEAAKVGEERLRAPGAVGADQDRVPVPVSVGNLLERGVEDGDVVGGGVGTGVARAQQGGEELAGVVAEREQGVVAEGVLERRRGMFGPYPRVVDTGWSITRRAAA
jgi:hypothetical protein